MAALVAVTVAFSTLLPATLPSAAATARIVAYPKPSIDISYTGGGSTLRTGDAIQFSVTVKAGRDLTYQWSFPGGDTAIGPTVTRSFSNYGSQAISVVATDPIGQTAEADTQLSVYPQPPTAAFTFNVQPGFGYYYVAFDASGSTGTDLGNYTWNFGDGNGDTSSGPQDYHYYNTSRTYTVQLTVTDGAGQQATTSQQVVVH